MKRRTLLACCCTGATVPLAGCGPYNPEGEPTQILRIRVVEIHPEDSQYRLTVRVEAAFPKIPAEDVVLVGYSRNGNHTCREEIGVLGNSRLEEKLVVNCVDFPEIITLKSTLSPCDHSIDLVLWAGTEKQKRLHIPDEISSDTVVWNDSYTRKCGENLPPERFLNDQGTDTPSP